MIEELLGITLQSIPYTEKKRIVTAFTLEKGLITFILRDLSFQKSASFPLCSPFCLAEFTVSKGKSDIFILKESRIIDEHSDLRKDLAYIQNAYLMGKAIMDSQLSHKTSPSLFLLLKTYLKNIPLIEFQDSLLISFLLKILSHEGLIHLTQKCNLCDKSAHLLHKGEALCSDHEIPFCHVFSNPEYDLLTKLNQVKSFSEIKTLKTNFELKNKVISLFKELV